MARPYSQDLRAQVVGSVAADRSCRATAVLFGVSVASVVKWCHRWRTTGSAAAKQMGGWKRLLLVSRAIVAELAARGTPASYGAVWRFFKREGITFKKGLHASEQDRADISRRRARWKQHQGRLEPGVHRRDLGQRQHDAAARALTTRRPDYCEKCRRAAAHAALSGGIAL
jgi:transposase